MIEDYKITDNKVTAYDSNKGFIDFEYQENIDDIFIEENVIEKINEELTNKRLDKIQNEHNYNIKYSKKTLLIGILSTTLLCCGMSFVLFYKIPIIAVFFTLALSSFTNGFLYLVDLEPKNNLKNKINADTLEIQKLEELLEKENNKLKELKKNKKNDKKIDKSYSFKKRSNDRLEHIDYLKNLYRTCGYCAKKLMKYQEKGILEDKFKNHYYIDDISLVETIIKEDCPKLIKKRK